MRGLLTHQGRYFSCALATTLLLTFGCAQKRARVIPPPSIGSSSEAAHQLSQPESPDEANAGQPTGALAANPEPQISTKESLSAQSDSQDRQKEQEIIELKLRLRDAEERLRAAELPSRSKDKSPKHDRARERVTAIRYESKPNPPEAAPPNPVTLTVVTSTPQLPGEQTSKPEGNNWESFTKVGLIISIILGIIISFYRHLAIRNKNVDRIDAGLTLIHILRDIWELLASSPACALVILEIIWIRHKPVICTTLIGFAVIGVSLYAVVYGLT